MISRRSIVSTILLAAFLLVSGKSLADTLSTDLDIDLSDMSKRLSIRYYIAEKGEPPAKYIILGGVSIYPNFLQGEFDFRHEMVEFDLTSSGYIYTFRVPGRYRFMRDEGRRDGFYYYTKRDMALEGIGIELTSLDGHEKRLRAKIRREVWLEDVKYNLARERESRRGKGLLSIDIPIPLPKQLERIIGSGEATNLTVQGRESITIGGESRWCANCPQTEGRPEQNKFPDLDMEQKLSVDLHGNIGEKINVEISHASQGMGIGSTNRVRMNYTGFDDEIIKLIEMGDTDLTLRGAQLISYSGTAKGLFGVKTVAQVGPMELTVIASKEEGETATGTFTATGGQTSSFTIADNDFIKRQFFYLETPGDTFIPPAAGFGNTYPVIGGLDGLDEVEVYTSLRVSERGQSGEAEFYLHAYPVPGNGEVDSTENYHEGWFRKLEIEEDYELIQQYTDESVTRYIGIRLLRSLDTDRALAVCYKSERIDTNDVVLATYVVGDYRTDKENSEDSPWIAELICPPFEDFGPGSTVSPYPSTWKMMMRNVYHFGLLSIDPDAPLKIRIERDINADYRYIHAESGLHYIRLFGLDRYYRSGAEGKDDEVDIFPQIIDLEEGYIIFPWPEPFDPPYEVMLDLKYIDPVRYPEEAAFDYETLARNGLIYNEILTSSQKYANHFYKIMVEIVVW